MVGCGSSCEEGTADLMGSLVGGPMPTPTPTPTPGSGPGLFMMMGELSFQTRHGGDLITVGRTRTKKQL